jgi:hypothetical protein
VARRLRYAAGGLLLVACLAGCVSIPSGGPVRSYSVTQGPGGQSQRYVQMIPEPPEPGWSPPEIVQGFLTASASFADRQQTAREYLTTRGSRYWNPSWSAMVFGGTGPSVRSVALSGGGKRHQATAATVTVAGKVQASLSGAGTYAVPSTASTAGGQSYSNFFHLVNVGGQWRISSAPNVLLLTSVEFEADYQLRNLYFFDPTGRYLVPDPVYVPLQATPSDLMNVLVKDLITQPKDWLAYGATRTAFPAGTKLMSDVMLDGGTAAVNLGGAIARASVSDEVRRQVSAQLFSTLSGSSQGQPLVQSVELFQNGKPWSPPGAQDNPVQHDSEYSAPDGASGQFYNLDGDGQLLRRSGAVGAVGAASRVARIGTGYSAIAVSRDGRYLAALRNGTIYTGPVGGPLAPHPGTTGYTTMSWAPNDDLWAAGSNGIVMLRPNASPRSAPVQVQVLTSTRGPDPGPFTALSVAPDGVRVAVITGTSGQADLDFGAIVAQSPRGGQPAQAKIQLSPFSVSQTNASFQSVTWYGPDNVITLAASASGPALTEYPVNGGTATTIPSQQDIVSITASYGGALIAGAKRGVLRADASISGSWTSIGSGMTPAYPG